MSRIWTVPNLFTIARGLLAFPLGYAIWTASFKTAFVIIFFAGLSDGLDGYIARRTGQTSDLGRLLDPMADKLLFLVTFVTISLPGRGFEPMPWAVGFCAIVRDVLIIAVASIVYRRTGFSGFTPTFLGKLNTALELWVVTVFLFTRTFGWPDALLNLSIVVTLVSIAVSGGHYIFHLRHQLAAYRQTPVQ